MLRKTTRRTQVYVYEPLSGETATLYEMGIPVVETGDRYHVDVQQKVPLNMDRDNVTPAYLRAIRVAVLNATHHDRLDDANSTTWVREACSDERVETEAVKTAMTLRFGDNAVRYDPSDPEANKRSVAEGRPRCLWREPHVSRVVQCEPGRRAAGGRGRDAEPQALFPGRRPAGRGSRERVDNRDAADRQLCNADRAGIAWLPCPCRHCP